MITNILLEHRWLSPTALIVMVVLGPPIGAWLSTRPRIAEILAALALVPVALLTLVPVDRQLYGRCEVAWTLPTIGRVELAANVVLFIVPVMLAAVVLRRPVVAVLAGTVLSVAIEAFQALVPALGRSCSTNDWLTNTIGAVIGGLLGASALLIARISSTRGPRDAP